MLSRPYALAAAVVHGSCDDDTPGAGARLPLIGVEVRPSVAGDAMPEVIGHRSCEVDQLPVEVVIERRAAIGGARLKRAKDVLRQAHRDGPEREERWQDARSIGAECSLDLGQRPTLQREDGDLAPREAPCPAIPARVAVPGPYLTLQPTRGHAREPRYLAQVVRRRRMKEHGTDALALISHVSLLPLTLFWVVWTQNTVR